jgi:hypothetical protein
VRDVGAGVDIVLGLWDWWMGRGAELLRRIVTRPAVEKVKLRWLKVEPWGATMRR